MRFVCCPDCGGFENVIRIGTVGRRNVRDSRRVKCNDCRTTWLTDGNTFWEEIGRAK